MGVVFVHQGQVVVLVDLVLHHRFHAMLQDHGDFVTKGGVVAAYVGDCTGHQMAVAIFVL